MRYLSFLKKPILFSLILVLAAACSKDDTTVDPINNSPSIQLVTEAGFISEDSNLEPGTAILVKVSATQGSSPLNTMTIYEDDVKVDLSRLTINNASGSANPALIFNDDKTSLTWTIEIQGSTEEGFKAYEFTVTDEDGLTSTVFLNITYVVQGTLTMVQTPGSGSNSVCTVPNTLFSVKADATRAGSPLNELAVYEDGVLVTDLTRLRCDNVDFTNNPLTLDASDKDGFTEKEILIKTHDPGTKVYTLEIIDEAGNKESFDITIQTGTEAGVLNNKVLTNRANTGVFTGGLNLLTGEPTGTTASNPNNNSEDAHIRDEGNDGAGEWLRKISAMNGSVIKTPFSTIDFNTLTKREDIVNQFNLGNTITESDPIEVGDIFLIENGGNYFIIQAVEVNPTAAGDEDDNIVFNIKQ